MHVAEDNRFCLPARIRTRLVPEPVPPTDRELARRLAGLPCARTAGENPESRPWTLDVFLRRQGSNGCEGLPSVLLCRIGSDGISVEGLSDNERHQVVSRGWGQLENRRVRLFRPRDSEEMEICWTILRRAYDSILSAPADPSAAPRASAADLPEISRTSLC